ncbi:MAG: hypothetical protein QXK89_07505 [Candidatus Bathyarchaeia archaeon]|nr:hypothetical protein [Candidatus Bathyarchaeota archaeon]
MDDSRASSRAVSLLDVISRLFESGEYFGDLPAGVINVELITSEAVRVMFVDKVDCDLFCIIAVEEGYSIDARGYAPRIIDRGNIIARVGSRSDPGADRNIFIYLFPTSPGAMSMYMKAAAIRFGILNPATNKINMEKLLKHNMKVIRLIERYRKTRYKDLIREMET